MGLAEEDHEKENKPLQSSGLAPEGTAGPRELESKRRPRPAGALPSFSPVRPCGPAPLLGVSPESEEKFSLSFRNGRHVFSAEGIDCGRLVMENCPTARDERDKPEKRKMNDVGQ